MSGGCPSRPQSVWEQRGGLLAPCGARPPPGWRGLSARRKPQRRGRACRCSPGFTEISPEGAQGFCCRCLPEVPASPLPCSGELGDASEGIVTRRGTELRAPFRTVRGPRRSQLLRVGCEDQDRGCWRMRKGSPKLCKQSQFQVHSLGWEIDSRKTQRKTNRQFRGGWRQIRSGNKGKTLFL